MRIILMVVTVLAGSAHGATWTVGDQAAYSGCAGVIIPQIGASPRIRVD